MPHRVFGEPPASVTPGETIFADVVGPMPQGRFGRSHIHCMIDAATRRVEAFAMGEPTSEGVVRILDRWWNLHGPFEQLITDNAAYYQGFSPVMHTKTRKDASKAS